MSLIIRLKEISPEPGDTLQMGFKSIMRTSRGIEEIEGSNVDD